MLISCRLSLTVSTLLPAILADGQGDNVWKNKGKHVDDRLADFDSMSIVHIVRWNGFDGHRDGRRFEDKFCSTRNNSCVHFCMLVTTLADPEMKSLTLSHSSNRETHFETTIAHQTTMIRSLSMQVGAPHATRLSKVRRSVGLDPNAFANVPCSYY